MSKKLTNKEIKDRLRAIRLSRTGEIVGETGSTVTSSNDVCRLGRGQIYVTYRTQETGRAYQSAAWQVVGVYKRTNPDGYWRDYGHKTFDVFSPREDKQKILEQALAWASEYLSLPADAAPWERDVFGSYQRPEVILHAYKRAGILG